MTGAENQTTCLLPGGYVDSSGLVHREAVLKQLSGREEELLARMAGAVPANLVTQILCHCVLRIGTVTPVTPAVARQLLIADRQFLLLKLREITFGDRVEGTLLCPWPDCGAKVDIDFSTTAVPVRRCENVAPTYFVDLSPEALSASVGIPERISFRLPNGDDQEALAPVLAENPAEALTHLLERCLVVEETSPDEQRLADKLSARARLEIEQAMEAHAPHIQLEMGLTCPECGRAFTAPFDVQDFFFGELKTSRDLLYRQVHYLAYHYHWSEREILEMTREKRLAYIEILADEIEAMNNAL